MVTAQTGRKRCVQTHSVVAFDERLLLLLLLLLDGETNAAREGKERWKAG
jgi:hypothetical protein